MEKLIAVKQLDDEKLSDLKKMAAICEDFENLRLKLNWNLLSFRTGEYTDDFLYYQDGQLIGSLHLFAFEQKTAEINGMVHPAYRQQGVFSKLLTRVQQECASRNLSRLLFLVERNSVSGTAVLQKQKADFSHTECKMECKKSSYYPGNPIVRLEKALPEDAAMLAAMDAACFPQPTEETGGRSAFAESWLRHPKIQTFNAFREDKKIGKISMSNVDNVIWIYGLCIIPDFRGQGYGKDMLRQVMNLPMCEGAAVDLEVDINNSVAIKLYQEFGFQEITLYDYYKMMIGM